METVEELCESIAIVDQGKVVVSGTLRDVKHAMGRQVVRLALDGHGNGTDGADDAAWVAEIPGVRLTRRGEDFSEYVVETGTDPGRILDAALARGARVTRFEIADPSLEEVFIEHVGRRAVAEEERHLAGAGAAR
jgi:ABC-2 type transport system ATP-binding protein